jgi:site-specific DNA-methyltransferase (adenine-specific)
MWDFTKRSEDSMYSQHPKGRFPTNVVLSKDEQISKMLNYQSGRKSSDVSTYFFNVEMDSPFLYCKKPSSVERGIGNNHPTVKPINLMRYLVRTVTPPSGVVLDPFMGSGSTGLAAILEGFQFLGIEKSEEYFQIANQRMKGIENV